MLLQITFKVGGIPVNDVVELADKAVVDGLLRTARETLPFIFDHIRHLPGGQKHVQGLLGPVCRRLDELQTDAGPLLPFLKKRHLRKRRPDAARIAVQLSPIG
ncbi:hypothetical protein D3C81_1883640 [compost metagenome]